ncbi:glycosyltransferase family 25 protein [Aminobacter sp. MET-1]|uniref:glycosyltransferase family 25 protein n=1 Tax=Aminobacter sp. MET-1 TaxID=2951085 RepID=UPI00226ADDEC|nr:glycosyltransferase family 25 protein [Aminobacter sp. MET-1]MCX8568566.1 glycosyltransferase family 25 protein [Aminobacter sp. MET-1]
MIRAYVINLDRSPERMLQMRDMLQQLDLPFQRISAVDGNALSPELIDEVTRLAPGQKSPTAGQVGCFLSHRLAWEQIAGGQDDYGLVLEDDVIFASNFKRVVTDHQLYKAGADIIRLEGWPERAWISANGRKVCDGYRAHRLSWDTYGTCGYLISRRCARKLVEAARLYTAPIDHMMFTTRGDVFKMADIEALVPAACFQHLFYHGRADGPMASTITLAITPAIKRAKGNFPTRVAREFARLADKLARLLRGERRKAVLLHPTGPLALAGDGKAEDAGRLLQ